MEEGLFTACAAVLLSGIEFERAEDGVGEFERRREVALHATVQRVAEDRIGPRSYLVPHKTVRRNQDVAHRVAEEFAAPEVDFVSTTSFGQVE